MATTRRDLLKFGLNGALAVGFGSSLPFTFPSRLAAADGAATVPPGKVLVVVQWSGGNDGLNTVVPVGNDDYFKLRPKLALKNKLHKLDDALALNPGMAGFKGLFDQGHLAVINGCGYPKPNRSHFRSMEIWHTANPEESEPCGWLGHYLDRVLKADPAPAKAINLAGELPQALVAEGAPVPSIGSIDDFKVRTDGNTGFDAALEQELIKSFNAARADSAKIAFLTAQTTAAIQATEEINRKVKSYQPDANYPGGLGQQLRLAAQLIAADIGTRIIYCQVGGFDTHSNQLGGHESVLSQISESISAFQKDLGAKHLDDRALVLCFSEFGRRCAENASAGTDHGTAGPMFLVGSGVKGGLHGAYPSLTDLDDGDLKFTTDFRRVYATVLEKWMQADATAVLGKKFESMAVL